MTNNFMTYVLRNQADNLEQALYEASECGRIYEAYDIYKDSKAVIERTLEGLEEVKNLLGNDYEDLLETYESLYEDLKEKYKENADDPRIIEEGELFEYSSEDEEDEVKKDKFAHIQVNWDESSHEKMISKLEKKKIEALSQIKSSDAKTIWKVLDKHTGENFHTECAFVANGFYWMLESFDDPQECREVIESFGYYEHELGEYLLDRDN